MSSPVLSHYIQCIKCVMDNINDPDISFDDGGVCNYCREFQANNVENFKTNNYSKDKLNRLIENIKKDGRKKKYDCVIGISGGTDSAYLVYKAVELGLRPLAIHYDNGWNSETATQNIEVILKKLNVDLYTYVNDWEEFKDLQLSFIKAGVVDIELITDLAIISLLYKSSVRYKTKYVLQGHNNSSEFILPKSWYHYKHDSLNIKAIHKKHGTISLKSTPILGFWEMYYHIKLRKTQPIYLLEYLNYNKLQAQKELAEKFDWKNYGAKHNESIFTRFYQNYILPKKFNIDKRKAHLSSLICSGQITKQEAIKELAFDPTKSPQTIEDKEYILKKLGISEIVFDDWMKESPVSHLKYASHLTRHVKIIKMLKKTFKF